MSEENKLKLKEGLEWGYCFIIAVILALLVRYFIGTLTIVKQPSMYPTLKQDQRLVLNRLARTLKETPNRGEIVTFEAPSNIYITSAQADRQNPVAQYEKEPTNPIFKFGYYVLEIGKTSYIKRVIGLPGEHVKIENGKVYINGKELEEPYLQPNVETNSLDGPFTDFIVPEGYVFLMGDNRSHSTDCRRFGCIPIEKLEGKVWIRFWPLNQIGKVE